MTRCELPQRECKRLIGTNWAFNWKFRIDWARKVNNLVFREALSYFPGYETMPSQGQSFLGILALPRCFVMYPDSRVQYFVYANSFVFVLRFN